MREGSVQAVLLAGDRGASKAVRGASKGFVKVAGKPMVVHVLEALLHTPEVNEIFAVGDPIKLEKAISEYGVPLRGRCDSTAHDRLRAGSGG